MSSPPEQPPISVEQRSSLYTLVQQSLGTNTGPLPPDAAVALKALLDAERWFGPVRATRWHVETGSDRTVRMLLLGVQYITTTVSVPLEMTPEMAEDMAGKLEEAALFARMAVRWNEGGLS
ncbi:hypothetical protein [Nocardia brasiliensis]|uniref:hypothetical protein n=1 Tax=Nocardia brasiliensis TaxID=37326 RepID=UPI002457C8FC|nr:hypothetical protein [Nocardia brasiliensis]